MACQPCQQRQAKLNRLLPGLGDAVAAVIDVIVRALGTIVHYVRGGDRVHQ